MGIMISRIFTSPFEWKLAQQGVRDSGSMSARHSASLVNSPRIIQYNWLTEHDLVELVPIEGGRAFSLCESKFSPCTIAWIELGSTNFYQSTRALRERTGSGAIVTD